MYIGRRHCGPDAANSLRVRHIGPPNAHKRAHMPSDTHAHLPVWIISGFPLSLSALWPTVPQRDSDRSGAHHTSRRRCIFIAPATAAARPPDLSLVSPQTNGDAQDLHPARWMHFKPVSLDYSQWILMHSLRVYQNQGPAIKGAAPNLFF